MIRAVAIGVVHMHINEVALYMSEQPDFELVAFADVNAGSEELEPFRYTRKWNFNNIKENYCSTTYDDYKKMLDEVKPDIAFIMCENCLKPEIVEECAKRGINVSIEKPLALNLEDAKKIQASVTKYGIEAVVNWPIMWRPYLHKMKAALDKKIVGEPIKLRYINGHTGPVGKGAKHRGVTDNAEEMTDEQRAKTGWYTDKFHGGVFLDMCCYGCFFSKWIMGDDEETMLAYGANLNTPFGDADDNCAAIIKYDGTKMAVLEGTWSTPRVVMPSGPSFLCTDGVITCTGGAENAPDVKAYNMYGEEVEMDEIELGDEYKNMPFHYAHHINTGAPVDEMLTLEKNVQIMAMLDAAMKSSKSGKEEEIDA